MAVTVKEITLWRREIDNRPGMLAQTLGPLAKGVDVEVVMAYRFPGDESRGAVELFPISGKKAVAAAQAAGLTAAADIPAVLVTGTNRSGIGYDTTTAIAEAGINLAFVVAQVIGSKFSAVYGFDNEADRRKAVALLKKSLGGRK
jgi:predicted amino acid-binding ACT domain protein